MNAFIRKEIRLLLPAWCVAMILATLPGLLFRQPDPCEVSFVIGMLLLAQIPFGREFSLGTFASVLAGPVSRSRVWWTKVCLMSFALTTVWLMYGIVHEIAVASKPWDSMRELKSTWYWIVICLAGGLWGPLVFRHVAAALWATLLPPIALEIIASWLRINFSYFNILIAYALLASAVSLILFVQAQDCGWGGSVISKSVRGLQVPALFRRGQLSTLICKELQLQQITLSLCILLFALHVGAILASESIVHWAVQETWALWLTIPMLAGCASMAEERRFGVSQQQLCLPLSWFRQYVAKLIVCLTIGALFGGVIPWLIQCAGGDKGQAWTMSPEGWLMLSRLCSAACGIALTSFFASTLSRSVLQAMLVLCALYLLGALLFKTRLFLTSFGAVSSSPIVFYVSAPVLIVTLLSLSYGNSKDIRPVEKLWIRNAVGLALSCSAIVCLTLAIYDRCWERALSLEAPHTAPRWSESGKAKIASSGAFVLLPDGKLWTVRKYGRSNRADTITSVTGQFLDGTNWIDLAANTLEAVAIRRDGTLWRIKSAAGLSPFQEFRKHLVEVSKSKEFVFDPLLEQVGTDTNWAKVRAGRLHTLAIKCDGTLWGWGSNRLAELLDLQKNTTQPSRLGSDADWADVFAGEFNSIAVKGDGGVWGWGTGVGEPRRLPLPIARWVSIAKRGNSYIGLNEDGSIWSVGSWRNSVLDSASIRPSDREPVLTEQVGSWRDIHESEVMCGLKGDGSLWMCQNPVREGRIASKHRDWISVTADRYMMTALARDGTLSCWGEQVYDEFGTMTRWPILAPTRRPLWQINMFEAN